MGGLVAIHAVLRNRSFFSGIVLEGPLIAPTSKPSFIMYQISKVARVLIPDYVYMGMNLDDVTKDEVGLKSHPRFRLFTSRIFGNLSVSFNVMFMQLGKIIR